LPTTGQHKHTDRKIETIAAALHDVCQPLTALQCRLELSGIRETPSAMRQDIDGALHDCLRMIDAVSRMREAVAAARAETAPPKRPVLRAETRRTTNLRRAC